MNHNVTTAVGASGACTAAVVWAVGLTIWQPPTEPRPWLNEVAGNNTYWARDLRYFAIAVALAGLVLAFRGSRKRTGYLLLGVLGWLGLDVWLDRIDVAGGTAAAMLSVALCAVVVGSAYADRRRPGQQSRGVLTATAAITAALVPVLWIVQSADDADMAAPAVVSARVVVGVLLAGTALLCALLVTHRTGIGRIAGAGVLTVAASIGGYLMSRAASDTGLVELSALAFVLFAGVTLLTSDRRPSGVRDWIGYLAIAAYAVAGYAILVVIVGIWTSYYIPLPSLLTSLAGSPPVNAADSDVIMVLCGLVPGLVFALLLTLLRRGSAAVSYKTSR